MMNRVCKLLAVLLVTVGAIAVAASVEAGTLVNRNGVIWDNTFEGDVASLTSSTPAWSVFDNNGFATESTDGDIYSYVSGSAGVSASYSAPNWAGAARTAEIRVRVPGTALEASDGSAVFTTSNVDAYDLRIYGDHLAYNGTGGLTDTGNIVSIDMSQFHILRAVVDTSAPFIYSLYIDNNPTPVLQRNDSWFAGFEALLFGDISTGGISGEVDVDYISWTSGAFAPIPEPSSLILLATGVLGILAGRRRS